MLPSPDLRRAPEHSALHRLIREHLATFIEHVEATGHGLPGFVRREMEAYLGCGLHASGFARVRCSPCGFERLVPFSCKGRGFCPSCGGRRMADTAAHLIDHVFRLDIPIRQWVLTLPHRLRYRLAYDHALTTAVLNIYTRTLLNWQRRRAGRVGQAGAVTHIQRFGGGANLNVHFHTLVTDGVFADDGKPAARFVPMPPPTPDDVRHLTATIARRIGRLLARRGDEPDLDLLADEEPVLAGCAATAIRQQQLFGPQPGAPTEREGGAPADGPANASPLSATIDGFNLHAATAVRGHDREGLERLCRYIARPPIATERLTRRMDGRYALRLKHPWRDGTTELVFDPLDLLARLAALVRRRTRTSSATTACTPPPPPCGRPWSPRATTPARRHARSYPCAAGFYGPNCSAACSGPTRSNAVDAASGCGSSRSSTTRRWSGTSWTTSACRRRCRS